MTILKTEEGYCVNDTSAQEYQTKCADKSYFFENAENKWNGYIRRVGTNCIETDNILQESYVDPALDETTGGLDQYGNKKAYGLIQNFNDGSQYRKKYHHEYWKCESKCSQINETATYMTCKGYNYNMNTGVCTLLKQLPDSCSTYVEDGNDGGYPRTNGAKQEISGSKP